MRLIVIILISLLLIIKSNFLTYSPFLEFTHYGKSK
jgi:hypothetical protein